VSPELFKGIEFVRISNLPEEQRQRIWKSFQQDKIIKIVRDQALMNDCILYPDYQQWLSQNQPSTPPPVAVTPSPRISFSKLAFE
jgi:hypothetical protein